MKYFKNLLLIAGAACAVASTGSVYAGTQITLCAAVMTGGQENRWTVAPVLYLPKKTNYYDVYCGNTKQGRTAKGFKEIQTEIYRQINTKSDRGWASLSTRFESYESAKGVCKSEYDSRSAKYKGEKHYNLCY